MENDKGYAFLGGFLLGGIVGAAVALLLTPASGEQIRDRIREEGIAVKHRGEEFRDDRVHEAQKMVQQGQQGVADAQKRTVLAVEEQKAHLTEALDVGKHAVSQRKDELLHRMKEDNASKIQANA